MSDYALAIDLGASSGRFILGHRDADGSVVTEEVYRFPNGFTHVNGEDCWDIDCLFEHILNGLKHCADLGKVPSTLGIDTWGVDYVLLDERGERIGNAVAYRDSRTNRMDALLEQTLPYSDHYARTGIAKQSYNTVYQLMADFRAHPERKESAKRMLFVPCYLSYLLCGKAVNEYTIASTSGLLNAESRDWDVTVLEAAGIPTELMGEKPLSPGSVLGSLRPEIAEQVGFNCEVVLTACHDTGSAFYAAAGIPADAVVISSGTWSLLGACLPDPILTDEAKDAGFTNEGGVDCVRFLQNIMGLWLLQEIRRLWGNRLSFGEMAELAEAGSGYRDVFPVTDQRFLNPPDMIEEIYASLREAGHPLPANDAELLYCVNHSLACCYAQAIEHLRKLLNRPFSSVLILGGGNQNKLLNRLTEELSGLPVRPGPTEGSALGNLNVQFFHLSRVSGDIHGKEVIC